MSMGMNLGLAMRMEVKCVQDITGGITTSIFPSVESALNSTEMQKSLQYAAKRKNMNLYRSMVDFLFCELWMKFRPVAKKYYADSCDENLAKHHMTVEERIDFEISMMQALAIAYKAMSHKRAMDWTKFRCEVLRLAA